MGPNLPVVGKARESLIKGSALFKVMFAHNNGVEEGTHTYSIRQSAVNKSVMQMIKHQTPLQRINDQEV